MPAHRFTRLAAWSALALLGALAPVRAQQLPEDARFAYEWRVGGGPLTGIYKVAPGSDPFTLDVYLRQTAGAVDVLAAEGGLFGGGVRATYGAPSGAAGVIRVADVADIVYNPAFNDTATSNGTRKANADFAEFRAATDLTQAATGNDRQIFLGSFTFQVLGQDGDFTVLTAGTVPTLGDTVTYSNFFELDPVIAPASLTIFVAPVPEPTGVLAVAASVALTGATWRRLRGGSRERDTGRGGHR